MPWPAWSPWRRRRCSPSVDCGARRVEAISARASFPAVGSEKRGALSGTISVGRSETDNEGPNADFRSNLFAASAARALAGGGSIMGSFRLNTSDGGTPGAHGLRPARPRSPVRTRTDDRHRGLAFPQRRCPMPRALDSSVTTSCRKTPSTPVPIGPPGATAGPPSTRSTSLILWAIRIRPTGSSAPTKFADKSARTRSPRAATSNAKPAGWGAWDRSPSPRVV